MARAYRARAEFRRLGPGSRWVLAGVVLDGDFWPARDGVERIRGRLAQPGLLGWRDIATPVVAANRDDAAAAALAVARATWPDADRTSVPWSSGTRDG